MTAEFRFSDDEYRKHVDQLDNELERQRLQAVDSRTLYGRVDRGWTLWAPERRAAQGELVRDVWDRDAPAVPRDGVALVVGGVDGAGKTTLRRSPEVGIEVDQYLVLDPEEIEEEMAERGMIPLIDGFSPMEASPLVHEEAWEIADHLAQRAIREKCNILWEIPMNSARWGQRINALNAAGYPVHGHFADIPPDLGRERAMLRHRQLEKAYRNGQGLGGRLLPRSIHESSYPSAPVEEFDVLPAPPGTPVRLLVEEYEDGVRDLEGLLVGLTQRWHARAGYSVAPADWTEVYRRCEAMPDDDSLSLGVLSRRPRCSHP